MLRDKLHETLRSVTAPLGYGNPFWKQMSLFVLKGINLFFILLFSYRAAAACGQYVAVGQQHGEACLWNISSDQCDVHLSVFKGRMLANV